MKYDLNGLVYFNISKSYSCLFTIVYGYMYRCNVFFFFSSRRRHTRLQGDWSSDVCSSDLPLVRQSKPRFRLFDFERRAVPDRVEEVRETRRIRVPVAAAVVLETRNREQIGRASCRERV